MRGEKRLARESPRIMMLYHRDPVMAYARSPDPVVWAPTPDNWHIAVKGIA